MGGGMSKYGVTYGSKAYKAIKAGLVSGVKSNQRQNDTGGTRFQDFGAGYTALQNSTQFFSANSNSDTWGHDDLTPAEYKAIRDYTGETGMSYHEVNGALYKKDYKDMTSAEQSAIDNMANGINKFVLTKGIQVTRQADFKIFGAKSGEQMTVNQIKDFIKKNADPKDGTLEQKGFLSSGANNHGADIDGSGLVIHFKVPPSVGAGAYVNPISKMGGSYENEFLFNCHSRFKFDTSSIYTDADGKIHINAVWKGRGKYK